MSARFVPQWLPGETLFSLASRYHVLAGNPFPYQTCLQLFGHKRWGAQHDFPTRLQQFEERTSGLLGRAEHFARGRTVLRFYLPFQTRSFAAGAIASLSGDRAGTLKYRLGLMAGGFGADHPLKACPHCMREDVDSVGVAYWHAEHQYPGVLVCPHHDEWLSRARSKFGSPWTYSWCLPASANLARCGPVRQTPETREACRKLGELVQRLTELDDGFQFDSRILYATFRGALKQRGMLRHGDGRLNVMALASFVPFQNETARIVH